MKHTIKLQGRNGNIISLDVDSYKTDSPVLIVHKETVIYMNTNEPTQLNRWVITHLPTGCEIINKIHSRKLAIQSANKLATLSGWDTVTLESAGEFYNQHRDFLLQVKGEAWG